MYEDIWKLPSCTLCWNIVLEWKGGTVKDIVVNMIKVNGERKGENELLVSSLKYLQMT